MWVNNEIGTIQPIPELAERVKTHGAIMHTDAVQAFGKVEIDVRKLGVRPALDLRPQDRRAEGHRRDVHPARHGDRAAVSRRSAGSRASSRHGERRVRRRRSRARPSSPSPSARRSGRASSTCAIGSRQGLSRAFPTPSIHGRGARARAAHRSTSRCPAPTASRCSWRSTSAASRARRARRVRAEACRRRTCCSRSAFRPSSPSAPIRMSLGSLTTTEGIDRVVEVFPALVEKARGCRARPS